MDSITLAKGKGKFVALGSNGEVQEVTDEAELTEIEQMVEERQAAGQKLTQALKKHGFNALSDEEETQVSE